MNIIRDKAFIKKVLDKMAQEGKFDIDNVVVNKDYAYIETIDHDKRDADFCMTEYNGYNYKVQYVSGCFNPYLFSLGKV